MLTPAGFDRLAQKIADTNQLALEQAGDYLVLVGDTPEFAEDGKVIVRDDDGAELARIILPPAASSRA